MEIRDPLPPGGTPFPTSMEKGESPFHSRPSTKLIPILSPKMITIASFHCFYKAFLFLHFIIEREIPQVQVIYDWTSGTRLSSGSLYIGLVELEKKLV
jgi:hypothetical protein